MSLSVAGCVLLLTVCLLPLWTGCMSLSVAGCVLLLTGCLLPLGTGCMLLCRAGCMSLSVAGCVLLSRLSRVLLLVAGCVSLWMVEGGFNSLEDARLWLTCAGSGVSDGLCRSSCSSLFTGGASMVTSPRMQ